MALQVRKTWLVAITLAALAALLGWAWADGGIRPITPQSAPAVLPGAGR